MFAVCLSHCSFLRLPQVKSLAQTGRRMRREPTCQKRWTPFLLCRSKHRCLCSTPIICVNVYVVMQEEKTEGRGRRKRKLSSQRVPAVKEFGTVVQTIRIQSVHVRDVRSLILSHHFTHINGFTQRPPSMRCLWNDCCYDWNPVFVFLWLIRCWGGWKGKKRETTCWGITNGTGSDTLCKHASSHFPLTDVLVWIFFIFRKQVLKRWWKSKSHAGVGHLRSGRNPKRISLQHLKNLRRWSRLRALGESVQDLQPVKAVVVKFFKNGNIAEMDRYFLYLSGCFYSFSFDSVDLRWSEERRE